MTIQCTLVEENAKVLKNRGKLAGLHRDMFESFDGVRRSENSLLLELSSKKTYPWRVRCDFGCLTVVLRREQLTKLLQIQIICTRKICTTCKLDSQSGVTKCIENVGNDVLLCNTDAEDLTFAIDANNTTSRLMICRDKDCFARNAVHINAYAGFEIVKVNKSVFGNEEDDAVTWRDLHCDRKVVRCLGRKEHIDSFLLEGRVVWIMIDLDDMQLERNQQDPE